MKKSRGPNIAKKLVKNSKDALLLGIEIHNKPICSYRLPSVVIMISHSWELLVKAYSYKYLNDKEILEKDDENRYKQFSRIIEKIYHTNTKKFRIFYDNLKLLNDWRNIIIHGTSFENLDELIYEIITKSILIYRDFIAEFFPKENLDNLINTPLLPIIFKLPFTTTDLLTKKSAAHNASKEVLEFLQKVQDTTKKLAEDGIDEMIFVGIKTEFTSEKKNADIISKIENDNPNAIIFKKNTVLKITNDPSVQAVRLTSYTEEQKNDIFPIRGGAKLKQEIKNKLIENGVKKNWDEAWYLKQLKKLKSDNENITWVVDTKNSNSHRYSQIFLSELYSAYNSKS